MGTDLRSVPVALLARLDGIDYQEIAHDAVRSAEQAARVRGTPRGLGAKAILIKIGSQMRVLALRADAELDNRAIKQHFGTTRTRFATVEELAALGLERGAVPPFGPPVLPYPLHVDTALATGPVLIFTAGRRDLSIRMRTEDWLAVAGVEECFPFARRGA